MIKQEGMNAASVNEPTAPTSNVGPGVPTHHHPVPALVNRTSRNLHPTTSTPTTSPIDVTKFVVSLNTIKFAVRRTKPGSWVFFSWHAATRTASMEH
mmetsp:Transcript_34848/g.75247  ORF Transcript_34848/g.75247 Transcript_34848/m.75247 type:complete len:97 (-) Transcript_34848:759-1049(-)